MLSDAALLRQACLIDGQWVQADGGAVLEVDNPATGEIVGTVPKCGQAETARAVEAARLAWPAWRAMTALARADVLLRWHDLILAAKDDLARLMTLEQGKPLAESGGEIAYGAGFLRWFAEEARRVYGDVVPSPWPGKRILVTREPVGVCGIITPWNFPTAMITRKAGPWAAPWWSSPPPRRPFPPWPWASWPSGPACPRACSISSPAIPGPSAWS